MAKIIKEKSTMCWLCIFFSIALIGVLPLISAAAPNVSLTNPSNGETFLSTNSVVLNCTVTDDFGLSNISLYHNLNTTFVLNQTRIFGGEIQPSFENSNVLSMHFNNDSTYENATRVYDWSNNGNNGSVINVSYNATVGKFFGSFFFSMDTDATESNSIRIEDSNSLDLTTNGTIEAWTKPQSLGDGTIHVVLTKEAEENKDSPYSVWLQETAGSAYKVRFFLGDSTVEQDILSTNSLDFNDWHHIALTWNGSIIKIYLDGILDSTHSQTVIPFNSNQVLRIGKNSFQNLGYKGNIDEIAIFNRTLIDSEIAIHAGIKPNNTNQTYEISNIPDGNHTWNCLAYDNESNSNWSVSNYTFYVNVNAPLINNVTNVPSSEDDLDPGIMVNVTVNVTEELYRRTVILQYKQSGTNTWLNATMTNSSSDMFNASFIASPSGTWNYRIWANDSSGKVNISSQINLSIEYDYSWLRNPIDFGAISGLLGISKSIGILIINNTGDYTLNFDLSNDAPYGMTYNETEPFDLDAKSVKYINITATFGNSQREDNILINITENISPSTRNTNLTLVSYAGGANLYNTLINYTATVNQSNSINLYGNVKNIGNETALDSNIAWVLPSAYWTNTTGNVTQSIGNLTIDSTAYTNATIEISPSVSPGAYTLYLNSTCSNTFGTCSDTDAFTVYVYCSNTDGICGNGCSYDTLSANYDLDCTAPAASTFSSGGGGSSKESSFYSKTIEIVRGKKDSFEILVYNNHLNSSLENVTLNITGFLSQYITISPDKINKIGSKETKSFNITLKIPSYKENYEEYLLQAKIRGKLIGKGPANEYLETQNIKLIIQEVSQIEANASLNLAEKVLKEMLNMYLNTKDVKRLIENAEAKLSEKRNKEAKDLAEEAIKIGKSTISTYSLINEIKQDILDAEERGLNTDKTKNLLNLAIAALERGDFTTSEKRALEAQFSFFLETQGKINPVKFIMTYWWAIIIFMATCSILLFSLYRKISIVLITENLKNLAKEEIEIIKLMGTTQKKAFESKDTSSSEYFRAMGQYYDRLNKIKIERARLEAKKAGIVAPHEKLKILEKENRTVLGLLKKAQENYFKKGNISKTKYEEEKYLENVRLAEIEEAKAILMATLEEEKILNMHKRSIFNRINHIISIYFEKFNKITEWRNI